MPESLAQKISLSFFPIIFVEGHIMNSLFVAIVPLYALVVRRTVRWRRYRFAEKFYKVEACIIIHMSLYMLSHILAWTQGWPLLPALRNGGRFLTIPLSKLPYNVQDVFIVSVDYIPNSYLVSLRSIWQLKLGILPKDINMLVNLLSRGSSNPESCTLFFWQLRNRGGGSKWHNHIELC